MAHRIYTTSVSSVYPHYVAKVERKGRTKAELDEVIEWLTGYDEATLQKHLDADTTFEAFFAEARLNPNSSSITGVVCGVRVEDIDDPLMQKIRYLDKLGRRAGQGQADGEGAARLNTTTLDCISLGGGGTSNVSPSGRPGTRPCRRRGAAWSALPMRTQNSDAVRAAVPFGGFAKTGLPDAATETTQTVVPVDCLEPDPNRVRGRDGRDWCRGAGGGTARSRRRSPCPSVREVVVEAEHLAVVSDTDEQRPALGVEEAAHGLDDDVLHLRVGLLRVQVPACSRLELDRLRLAGGDQVPHGQLALGGAWSPHRVAKPSRTTCAIRSRRRSRNVG